MRGEMGRGWLVGEGRELLGVVVSVVSSVEGSRLEGVVDKQPDGMNAGAAQSSVGAVCWSIGWVGGLVLFFDRLKRCLLSWRGSAIWVSRGCRIGGGSGCCRWVG